MNPQERQLVDDLFDRLARVETAPRDPDAARAISDGLRRAPNAVYALVQTVLLQDEALKHAHARIQQLEGEDHAPQQQGGFLDTMRDALFGGGAGERRGSVPNVRGPDASRANWNSGQVLPQASHGQPAYGQPGYGQPGYGQPAPGPGQGGFGQGGALGGGSSFLGTAAAAAAGMVGGSLLMNSLRSMTGGGSGGSQQSLADSNGLGGDKGGPWGGAGSGDNSLGQQAGLNDIGSSHGGGEAQRSSFFDQASNSSHDSYGDNEDFDNDFDGGDSDYA